MFWWVLEMLKAKHICCRYFNFPHNLFVLMISFAQCNNLMRYFCLQKCKKCIQFNLSIRDLCVNNLKLKHSNFKRTECALYWFTCSFENIYLLYVRNTMLIFDGGTYCFIDIYSNCFISHFRLKVSIYRRYDISRNSKNS